jgi:hypothetical protein
VDGELFTKPLVVLTDPQFPDYQPWERNGGFGTPDDGDEPDDEDERAPRPLDRDD